MRSFLGQGKMSIQERKGFAMISVDCWEIDAETAESIIGLSCNIP